MKNLNISERKSLFAKLLWTVALFFLCACSGVEQADEKPAIFISDGELKLRECLLDDNEYNRRRKMPAPFAKIETVTIHNTAGYMSAIEERNRLNDRRDNVSISFHFAVDENEAVQILPLTIHAWHAGDGATGEGNLYSVSIEICRSLHVGEKSVLYRRAEENGAILAAWLLDKYNLPISALKKHQDWSGKYCPHRILSENRWEQFKKNVESKMLPR